MGRLSPRSNDLPNLPNLHQPPQRSLYGNDGNDGRTPGGWRVELAEGAPAQGRGDGVRGSGRGRSLPVPPRPVSIGRGAGPARGGRHGASARCIPDDHGKTGLHKRGWGSKGTGRRVDQGEWSSVIS